jgi:dihydroorotate dehydrogenase electron transfer subunit
MRPISINAVDAEKGTLTLLYKVVGTGTELMSRLVAGDSVQMLGPLGKGFPIGKDCRRVAVIGRGIGIAPLRFLAETCLARGIEVYAYLSAKEPDYLFHRELLVSLGAVVRTTTDPAVHITDAFAEDLREKPFDAAYSCGSNRLARAMRDLHRQYGFPAYVSLEEHMACGIGACKGCVCREYGREDGTEHYARVCKDGPVFDVERVIP